MKLSEFKKNVIEIHGIEAWEEMEESYIYKLYTAPEEEQLQAVKEDGYDIEYMNNPSEEIQLEAVRQNGYSIQCINNPSEEVQLEAIKEDGLTIRYVKNPTEKMLQEAIKGFDMNNTYKLKYMLKFLENDLNEEREATNDTI